MRISEIKHCFENPRIIACVKAFWEEELFRQALEKEKSEPTPEKVYNTIRDVFLQALSVSQSDEEKRKIRKYKKDLRTLSKHMYGETYHWAYGTEYEQQYIAWEKQQQRRAETYERLNAISFLYERLSLSRITKKSDIVVQIAHNPRLSLAIMKQESSSSPITNMEELFDCLEKVILDSLHNEKWEYNFYYIMNSISYLAYKDSNYWLIKNRLTKDDIVGIKLSKQ